jgi:hypothetical protein
VRRRRGASSYAAFERLQAANPIGGFLELPQLRLPESLGVASERAPFGEEKHRFRPVLVLVLLAAAFFAVAPALGLHLPPLDFWAAEKAPPQVVSDFSSLDSGAPAGMAPGVIAGETRLVERTMLAGKRQELWVGPTKAGGYCVLWSHIGGGCDKNGTVPLNVFGSLTPTLIRVQPAGAHGVHRIQPPTHGKLVAVGGDVKSAWADSVELHFADGTVIRPDILWVSAPISAGFFSYTVPPEHQRPGHQMTSVVARDAHGNVVTVNHDMDLAWRPSPSAPPDDALVAEKRILIEAQTADGPAVLYVAPTRYEARCSWLELADRVYDRLCLSEKDENESGVGVGLIPTENAVVVVGDLRGKASTVALRFADGQSETIQPRERRLLSAIPPEHLSHGRELTELIVRDLSGRILVDNTGRDLGRVLPLSIPSGG